jgi:hypothetical protein
VHPIRHSGDGFVQQFGIFLVIGNQGDQFLGGHLDFDFKLGDPGFEEDMTEY